MTILATLLADFEKLAAGQPVTVNAGTEKIGAMTFANVLTVTRANGKLAISASLTQQ